MFKKILTLSLILFLCSCQKDLKGENSNTENKVEKTQPKDASKTKSNLKHVGIYEGEFPCEDCDYIPYKVIIRKDKTFYAKYIYKGKSDKIISEEGKYYWSDNEKVITLKSKKQLTKFKVGDNTLQMLSQGDMNVEPSMKEKFYIYKTN